MGKTQSFLERDITGQTEEMLNTKNNNDGPWLVRLNGLSAGLQTKGSPVQSPVRAHAWVVGQVPSRERVRGSHTLVFLSLSFSLPSSLSKNK